MSLTQSLSQEDIRALVKNYLADAERYKRNPHAMQRLSLDLLEKATEGKVDLVDPTNPFVFLLESSTLNSSLAINEYYINLRRQYPELAVSQDDLYLHMSDTEYLNIYSVPAQAEFKFAILLSDVLQNETKDPIDNSFKLVIPRGSSVTVDGKTFTLFYSIVIRRFDNGFIQVSHDTEHQSEIYPLTSSIIETEIRRDQDGNDWLMFDETLPQLKHRSHLTSIDDMSTYRQSIAFTDTYHWAEVYFRPNSGGNWIRVNTVMNETKYDYYRVTAILKVKDNRLEVLIPNFYQLSGNLSGEVRIDIYTTVGKLTMDMSLYNLQQFGLKFGYFDEERDTSIYSTRMQNAQHYVFSVEDVDDGRSAVDFVELRNRVIENSLGTYLQTPVSSVQLKNALLDSEFELVDHLDDITRKTILAVRRLPTADYPRYIAEMNAGLYPIAFRLTDIVDNYKVRHHPSEESFTLMSQSVFKEAGGSLELLDLDEVTRIKTLSVDEFMDTVNTGQYVFCPFYYVVDKVKAFDAVRIYELDSPSAGGRSIKAQNQTLNLLVQTGTVAIRKEEDGYRFTITTKSGANYKQLGTQEVRCQLAFKYKETEDLLYVDAPLLYTDPSGERMFEFTLNTNYYLDDKHNIETSSLTPLGATDPRSAMIPLSSSVQVIYTTSVVTTLYTRSEIDDAIHYGVIPNNFVGISMEEVEYTLGYPVSNLYRRLRSYPDADNYAKYTEDVFQTYEEDVYEVDPVTGSIYSVDAQGELVSTLLHAKGELVLDDQGEPIITHRKGEAKLDDKGDPVELPFDEAYKEMDLYHLEGHYYFLEKKSAQDYVKKIKRIVSEWSSVDLERIKERIILVNNLYYYPKTTLGVVKAVDEYNVERFISAAQSLDVKVWMYREYFKDTALKDAIELHIKAYLTTVIAESTINTNDIIRDIKSAYSAQIHLVTVNNLGGELDRLSLRISDTKERFCLAKRYYMRDDGVLDIEESIDIRFFMLS